MTDNLTVFEYIVTAGFIIICVFLYDLSRQLGAIHSKLCDMLDVQKTRYFDDDEDSDVA